MLFSLTMTWNGRIEDWTYSLTLVLPTWIVGLRYFAHKCTIHDSYFFIFVDLYRSITLRTALTCLFLIGLSGVGSIDSLAWWSCSFESTCYSLSESICLCLIRQYFLLCSDLFVFSFAIFSKYNLMNSSLLLSRFKSIYKG